MRKRRGSNLLSLLALIPIFLAAAGLLVLYQGSRFDRFDRFNVVFVGSPVKLVSVNVAAKNIDIISFPNDLYIPQLAHGYGPFEVGKIYAVGQLDRRGGETVAATVSDYLGVPVDGYVLGNDALRASPSDLNLMDRARVLLAMFTTRADKVNVVNLASLASPLVLVDGSQATSIDQDALDNALSGLFVEDRIRTENLRVAVINSTNVTGLGNRAARLLSNIGVSVVSVDNSDIALPGCQLLVDPKQKNTVTVNRIAAIFHCQIMSKGAGRADVVLTLGEDYASNF
ncbi:MAG: LCP family protein [Patescibacteria group bacterium]|nr:LCP family protein [Patescibacteria group bacterium]MCL5432123.1 LCP family protein [Patescibacteria group bacterium]